MGVNARKKAFLTADIRRDNVLALKIQSTLAKDIPSGRAGSSMMEMRQVDYWT